MTAAAIILASCLGYSGLLSMPMWLGPVGKSLGLTSAAMGAMASAELAAAALVSLGASRLVGRDRIRWGAALGLLLIGLGNLGAAAAAGTGGLAGARIVAGFGEGLALTFVNASIANTDNAGRYFAWSQMGLNLFFVGLFYFSAVPWVVGRLGSTAVLLFLGSAALLFTALAAKLPVASPKGTSTAVGSTRGQGTLWAALAGLAILFVGCQGAWAFLVTAGAAKGYSTAAVAHMLMISLGVGLAGPLVSRVLGGRYGWSFAVAFGLSVSGVAVLIATQPIAAHWFGMGAGIFNFATLSILTGYQSYLAVGDPSGRSVAAAPSVINLGAAVGPGAVGFLWNAAGPSATGWLIVASYLAGMCLLALGHHARSRLVSSQAASAKSQASR